MSHRKTSVSTINSHPSLEESSGFESKLSYLKSQPPRISYSQIALHCEIKCVSITPDEKYAAVGLEDGQVQLINIITTDEEFESTSILRGHKAEVKCLCITTNSDVVISGSYDKTIILWDIAEREQKSVLKGSEDKILSLCLSNDNTILVSGSIDNIIRVWDLQNLMQKSVIRTIESNSYSICITSNNNLLVLGCSDNVIRIWNITEHREEVRMEGHKWPVYSMALTNDGQYLLSTGMDHTIRKWEMLSYKQVCVLAECSETVYSLCITSDDMFVIFGKYNGDIGVVSLIGEMDLVTIECHKNCINSICVSKSNKYIVSGSRDGTIQISRLSESPEAQVLEGHSRKIYCLAISADSQMLASASDDHSIFIWRLGVEDCEGILKGHKGPVYSAIFTNDSRRCISGSQDQNIIIWDLSTETISATLRGHEEAVMFLTIDTKDKWLISTGVDKSIRIWDLDTNSLDGVLNGHTEKVTCLTLSADNMNITSGSKDRTLKLWSAVTKNEIVSVNAHDEEITSISLISSRLYKTSFINRSKHKSLKSLQSTDGMNLGSEEGNVGTTEKLISASLDKTIKIWNAITLDIENTLPCGKEVFKMCITADSLYMFVQCEKKFIKMWSLSDKQELINLYEGAEINALCISPDKQWLCYSNRNDIHMVKSPLNRESSLTVLPYSYSFLFRVLVHRVLNNDKSQKRSIFANYFICPANISILHILTYSSHSKMLKSAIYEGAKFFRTTSGETPLSIALSRKSKICAEILINMFSTRDFLTKPYIFEYLEGLLPVLNKSSLPSLHKLYNSSFPILDSTHLPTFGTFLKNPPVLMMSDTARVNPDLFIPIRPASASSLTDSEIEFRISMISLDLSPGSKECMNFMRSLLKCKNTEIFRTQFIKSVLKYKWRQIRWVLMTQGCLYLVLLCILILHTVYDRKHVGLLVLEILLNSLFLLYEASQAFSGLKSYLDDVWNMLDSSRILLAYAHAIVSLIGSNQSAADVLLTLLTIVTWTRLVGYLRIFDGTRYLIHMMIQVISDLGPFLIIFFMSSMGLTLTFYSDHPEENFGDWLLSTYSIAYGSWEFVQSSGLSYIIFYCGSFINTLILLNLLIALISDTYGSVSLQLDIVDMEELADIILEVDSILFWKRGIGKKQFLISCDVAGSYKKAKGLESQTKNIKKIIEEVDNRAKANDRSLERINQNLIKYSCREVGSKNESIIELILAIKNDFVSLKSEMQAELKQVKHDIASVKGELKAENTKP